MFVFSRHLIEMKIIWVNRCIQTVAVGEENRMTEITSVIKKTEALRDWRCTTDRLFTSLVYPLYLCRPSTRSKIVLVLTYTRHLTAQVVQVLLLLSYAFFYFIFFFTWWEEGCSGGGGDRGRFEGLRERPDSSSEDSYHLSGIWELLWCETSSTLIRSDKGDTGGWARRSTVPVCWWSGQGGDTRIKTFTFTQRLRGEVWEQTSPSLGWGTAIWG